MTAVRWRNPLPIRLLQKYNGGMGILLGGVPGVQRGQVVIVGGVVGANAARMAVGLGVKVTILDIIVDVAIDQGGSIETIDRITTHDDPCYAKHGVIHYSVANMPGAVPRTSTQALESATLPYLVRIANQGIKQALSNDSSLLAGLNTYAGKMTCKPAADYLGLDYTDPITLIS